MGRNTSSLTDTLELRFRLRLRTWTRGLRIMIWLIMLVFLHLMTALAWVWPFTTRTVPQAMGRFWTFLTISGSGCCHIWRHNILHILHGLDHTLHKNLGWGHFWFRLLSFSFQSSHFWLSQLQLSLCYIYYGIAEHWASRGSVAKEQWCRPDQCCVPMLILNLNFIHVWNNSFVHFCSIHHLFKYCGKTSWVGAIADWVWDVTTFAECDTAITPCAGDTLWHCTWNVCGLTALSVTFLGVHFFWFISLTGLLVATLPSWEVIPPGITFFYGGGTDFLMVALCFPPLTGILLLVRPAILFPLNTFSRFWYKVPTGEFYLYTLNKAVYHYLVLSKFSTRGTGMGIMLWDDLFCYRTLRIIT